MQKRSSSLLHKWLTPAEFGSLFGPADADVAKVTGWLQGEGFSVNKMSLGKGTIDFSGTVGTINAAVHTQMHTYDRNGVTFHSNSSDPQIPAALQPVVAGLVSLNYIQPQSNMIVLGTAKLNLQTHQAIPEWNDAQQCGSVVNGQSVVANCTLFVPAPGNLAVQYNLASVYKAGTSGQGVTVGVMSASNIDLGIVQNYRTAFGLANPENLPQVVIDGNDPGQNSASLEAYLDVESVAAMAPDATTILYASNGSLTWEQAAAQGQTVFVDRPDTEGPPGKCESHPVCARHGVSECVQRRDHRRQRCALRGGLTEL
jgi:subtilase family serine protease